MEWVETTAKSVDEAKELALDQLGVSTEDAEFEVLETPRPGLFGRVRGEARVRARVRPTPVRPKQDRRRGRRTEPRSGGGATVPSESPSGDGDEDAGPADTGEPRRSSAAGRRRRRSGGRGGQQPSSSEQGADMTGDEQRAERSEEDRGADGPEASPVEVEQVRDAAIEFVDGLTTAFGFETTVEAVVDGSEIEVRVSGDSLGLLIGPGGRTLLGIQDLARVAAQRRLGDHATRLRVDIAGYREKRRAALQRFATTVAEQVRDTGVARSLDAMPSADRKVLHDALAELDGVTSRSEGEEPNRRVVVSPV
jgi:spoIIIJ-associated protein